QSAARPPGAQLERQFLVSHVARGSIHVCTPVARNLDGYMTGGAEAVQSQVPAILDSRETQRAKSDDTGAEQRRRLLVCKAFRNGVNEVFRGQGVFGIASVYCIARERRMVT